MDRIWELSFVVDRLLVHLQVIAFFLMTTGFILRIRKAEAHPEATLSVVATALVLLGLMASQSWWFTQTQGVFFSIAHELKADYEAHPFASMHALRQKLHENEDRHRLKHVLSNVRAAVSEALLKALMALLIGIASVIQVLFTCIYCVLIEVFRLLFPLALCCFLFEGLKSIGFQFVLKCLSVMSWPVGFALIERIAHALQAQFYMAPSAMDRLHGGILFPLMLCLLVVGGTVKVPSLMSSLFSGELSTAASSWVSTSVQTFTRLTTRMSNQLSSQLKGLAVPGKPSVSVPPSSLALGCYSPPASPSSVAQGSVDSFPRASVAPKGPASSFTGLAQQLSQPKSISKHKPMS